MPEREREGPPGPPDGAPAPASSGIELPTTFGKYFLTEKLATGGMAEIYLAKIVGPGGFEKPLVIKQIHPRLSGQRHFVDLFVAEAKTLVTLAHGNIVPVYELGVIDDTYFIAMEYIDGPTLYRLTETLRRRDVQMAPPLAAWIAARILEGLDYAHRKGVGVIHRDLSPRNVMLSRDGEVKLVDFGIAVTLDSGTEDEGQSAPTGSFPYMSPEQVRKEALTAQTDLFSAGVLLWEMLVGNRLFARADPDATLHAVVESDIPRPSAQLPDVPARLDDVVMRALDRDMTARWASAADMLAALQRYLYGLEETPGPRDLAALVARYCPPETRRFPTHHDVHGDHELPPERTQPRARATSVTPAGDGEPPRPGPLTAVIPRDGAGARGKRHPRARTETFATHVELEQLLEGTPLIGVPAIREGEADTDVRDLDDAHDERDAHDDARDGAVRPDRLPRAEREDPTTPRTPADARTDRVEPAPLPGRVPPSRSLLIIAALGALALATASVYVFFTGRSAIDRPDAARDRDPSVALLDAASDAGDPPGDGEPPPPFDDATPPPDVPPVDAGLLDPRRDAGPRAPRPDARDPVELAPRDAAPARPRGTATLTIGANPWGDVLLDGKKIGRTPIERLSVPAGHHVIDVIFGGDDPPRTSRHTVDLADGEAKDVLADFTKPER
jgi:eukaryotic-like serine/threonine-protein kinase